MCPLFILPQKPDIVGLFSLCPQSPHYSYYIYITTLSFFLEKLRGLRGHYIENGHRYWIISYFDEGTLRGH